MCDSLGANKSPFINLIYFTTLYSCSWPTIRAATNITANAATLTWDPVLGAWGIYHDYKQDLQPWGAWIYDTVQTNSILLSTLSIGTNYHWQISAISNDSSTTSNNTPYSGYHNFSTPSTCSEALNLNTTNITANSAAKLGSNAWVGDTEFVIKNKTKVGIAGSTIPCM